MRSAGGSRAHPDVQACHADAGNRGTRRECARRRRACDPPSVFLCFSSHQRFVCLAGHYNVSDDVIKERVPPATSGFKSRTGRKFPPDPSLVSFISLNQRNLMNNLFRENVLEERKTRKDKGSKETEMNASAVAQWPFCLNILTHTVSFCRFLDLGRMSRMNTLNRSEK